MYERVGNSVLRCPQCNKPFDKESTLKRHGYYCRSRRAGGTTRPRSCVSCARGKSRCDVRRPGCSRCISKGIRCDYAAQVLRQKGSGNQNGNGTTAQQERVGPVLVAESLSSDNREGASAVGDLTLDSAFDISDSDFANLGDGYLDPETHFPDFFSTQTQKETADDSSLGWSSLAQQPKTLVRSFSPRASLTTRTQRDVDLILHTLKSYPLMIIRHSSLPPFIHSSLISPDDEDNNIEPLTSCLNLVYMLSSRFSGSRKLFWKNVRLECERWYAEHLQMNQWQLLAAMQALSIYVLIRLDEGETDHNNLDSLLVTTVIATATQFNLINIGYKTHSVVDKHSLNRSWKNWILEESARRLCVVYQVLSMLVHFEPAAMCDQTYIALAPLPARKQLWEAGDEQAWKAESNRKSGLQTTFGLAANGELVRLDEGQLYSSDEVLYQRSFDLGTPTREAANWEEWCTGMDGLGGLIMLAASFVAQ